MMNELRRFFRAFTYAADGVIYGIKHERNLRFHLCAAVTVIGFSGFYELTAAEKCVLLLCIALVISSELINTAVEAAVDIASEGQISPKAAAAKDCAAAAVLVCAVIAAVCGFVLFFDVDKLWSIFRWYCENLWAAVCLMAWLAASFCFIFGLKGKD